METLHYTPTITARNFILDYRPGELFYCWIIGPVGSGKTTADFMKLVYMAQLQRRGADGVRRTRCVVVRNTAPQLKDTTLKSWFDWFKPPAAGDWHATDKIFDLRFGDVECEVLFRPLDTEDDVSRVLSLETTFAIVDEFREVPKAIIEALSGRLGRYPSRRHGGATNHGMWGASNPGTEDSWWYEHLHNSENVEQFEFFGAGMQDAVRRHARRNPNPEIITRYYHQPSGLSDYAENLENLPPYEPGNKAYYINHARGKSPAYNKQMIDAQWGYSSSETPVVKSFNSDIHVAKSKPRYNPALKLAVGCDPGLAGTYWCFGQEDLLGRLLVLGELFEVGMGAERFIRERVDPYVRIKFPDSDIILNPDPASSNRAQTDERAVIEIYKKYFTCKEETNNRFPLRLNAIEYYTTTLVDGRPALIIDKEACPLLCRALAGGWRYEKARRSADGDFKSEPEKNPASHVGDGFGYLCRYYHRMMLKGRREDNYAAMTGKAAPQLRQRTVQYHFT